MDHFEKALLKAETGQFKPVEFKPSVLPVAANDTPEIVYSQTKRQLSNLEILRQRRVVSSNLYSVEAEPFRILRTRVLKSLRANQWNSFAVTAPTKHAGKSLVAVNLAIAMAMEVNQTVLLVDLDLRAPSLGNYFNYKVEYGLSDYLRADVPLSKILFNPGFDRLVVLPGRDRVEGSSELVSGPKMRNLVEELKNRYQSRILIFDLPPALASDDVMVCMDYFDAYLLVVENGGNTPAEVKKSVQLMSGSHLLGAVLNKCDVNSEFRQYY
jgi:capsular exopolysaccharide synthesis family protein